MTSLREKDQLSLRQRHELMIRDQSKPINISQKKYEMEQKIERMIDEPEEMREFYHTIRTIKTVKKSNFTTIINGNKCMARNWDVLVKLKKERLSTSIQANTRNVKRNKQKVFSITRRKHINYQKHWEKEREKVSPK